MLDTPETITGVAYVDRNGILWSLEKPARHHHVLQLMHERDADFKGFSRGGFITDQGRYITRAEAYEMAERQGIIKDRGPKGCTLRELFSEDLW